MAEPALVEGPPLRDRLRASGRQRFVGREAELALVRDALRASEPPFVVLHVHGPGGVGKTTLLRELDREAQQCGRRVIRLDGRDMHASPAGFRRALGEVLQLDGEAAAKPASTTSVPAGTLLLIDTFEKVEAIDRWLREQLLPQLPARCLVVIAGRNQPAADWRTDIEWAGLTRTVRLGNLRPQEAEAYLRTRGVPAERFESVHAFTHGHPLALSLVADVLSQGAAAFDAQRASDVIRVLIECFLRDVPSPRHSEVIEVSAQARNTTEALLAGALEGDDVPELFEWLRHLSFMEEGPHGMFPHDLAREAFMADLDWRDPPGREQRFARIYLHMVERIRRARGREQQRLQMEYLFLIRSVPTNRGFFDLTALDRVYAEPAAVRDAEFIAGLVSKHEGGAAARIARHWLQRQPQAFLVFRDVDGSSFGFLALLDIGCCTDEDRAVDPAIGPALALVEREHAIEADEAVLHLRFWMDVEKYQAVATPAFNLTAMNTVISALTRPRLAWHFVAMSDAARYEQHLSGINWVRSPAADFEIDGKRHGVFAHDWRLEPAQAWIAARLGMRAFARMPFAAAAAASPAGAEIRLGRAEFERAVRDALRDFTRPDRLAGNPLLQANLLRASAAAAATGAPAAQLQSLLRDAILALKTHPRDEKLHRALWHTYIEPLASQEKVAERLDLPFSTYRYHLAKGIDRVVEILRQREALRP